MAQPRWVFLRRRCAIPARSGVRRAGTARLAQIWNASGEPTAHDLERAADCRHLGGDELYRLRLLDARPSPPQMQVCNTLSNHRRNYHKANRRNPRENFRRIAEGQERTQAPACGATSVAVLLGFRRYPAIFPYGRTYSMAPHSLSAPRHVHNLSCLCACALLYYLRLESLLAARRLEGRRKRAYRT